MSVQRASLKAHALGSPSVFPDILLVQYDVTPILSTSDAVELSVGDVVPAGGMQMRPTQLGSMQELLHVGGVTARDFSIRFIECEIITFLAYVEV